MNPPIYLDLGKLPPRGDLHLTADWLELFVVAQLDQEASASELARRRADQRDIGAAGRADLKSTLRGVLEPEAADPSVVGEALDEPVDDAVAPDQGDQAARAQGKAKPNAKPPRTDSKRQPTERDLAEVSDVWRHLQDRLRALGSEYYPFELDNDGREVRLRKLLAPAHRTYIAMLLCSNLNRIDRSYHRELTESFERMGVPAMQAWLGRWYRVELFGTSAASEDLYGGQKLRDAIKLLGKDLGWPARKKAIKGIGRKGGDRGLDIVAYHIDQSGDVRNHWLVFFAQCGVGKNWKPKQQEPSWVRWRKLLDITGPMQPVLLMPYWQRETGGELRDETWITVDIAFLDRLRLLRLLGASPEHPAAPPVAAGAFETG